MEGAIESDIVDVILYVDALDTNAEETKREAEVQHRKCKVDSYT